MSPLLDDRLRDMYYGDDLLGLATASHLAQYARAHGLDVSLKQARQFINNQESSQRFRPLLRRKYSIPVTGPPGWFQGDLLFYHGKTILVVMGIMSRKLYTALLKDKTAKSCALAFRHIVKEIRASKDTITALETDSGGEFMGAFKTACKDLGVVQKLYESTLSADTALSKVERVNRTIRQFLNKSPNSANTLSTTLPKVTRFYNNKPHSATGVAPQAFTDYGRQWVREQAQGHDGYLNIKQDFPIGTKVRIALSYNLFQKKTQLRWSKDVYRITKQEGYTFDVVNTKDAEDTRTALRAWELLPVTKSEGRTQVTENEVEDVPQRTSDETPVTPAPAVAEPRQPRQRKAPKPKDVVRQPKPAPAPRKEKVLYIVQSVKGHKRRNKTLYFLVKFKNIPKPSYQPEDNFIFEESGKKVYNPLVAAYLDKHPQIQAKLRK
jgi:hypothetical protein